ncbi:uncharacterized protein Dwil_GK17083 [Drosophila willistoni]|uniref:Chitin-binding type-2 domain-containing protein n=1 Tax=Drosophila willistoni TaxID=7260 RepID=B4MNA7_DROWI|nr:uncharacterized protein LOC6639282 [Drosophila willistoni]EDW72616.1 uncharacterized protein Dwil_GK17083 [Drosophila willistoni]
MTYQVSVLLLSLFLLAGCAFAEDFSECSNVEVDTFVMVIEDCASYIYCNGEDSFRDMCPEQTYFDAQSKECAFDDEGVCLRKDTLEADVPIVAAAAEGEIESEDTLTEINEGDNSAEEEAENVVTTAAPGPSTVPRPHCDPANDSFHPHPQRCEYYYSCISGYLTIVRCPYKYGWDVATEQCKPLTDAQCFSSL